MTRPAVSSITTSLETTDAVLDLIPSPAAILLQMPSRSDVSYRSFLDLAERLRARTANVPVILIDPATRSGAGFGAALRSRFGALHQPEL